jgi:hypothetical protein
VVALTFGKIRAFFFLTKLIVYNAHLDFFCVSAFSTLSLAQPHGILERYMVYGNGIRGIPVCLCLKYYLEPNSEANIKVVVEDEARNQVILGTVTASDKDIQVMVI